MQIRELSDSGLIEAYGIRYQALYPVKDEDSAPLGLGWAVVEPGQSTAPHEHTEHEIFTIVRGQGRMTIAAETADVRADQAVLIPGGQRHALANTGTEPLIFLSTYWAPDLGAIDL